MSALVIGIGHPFRHDDAVGWLVAERVAALKLANVTVLTHHGEGTDLMARWHGFDRVVLVDATVSGTEPGVLRCWDGAEVLPTSCFPKSSHVFGVAEGVEMARLLGRLPPFLRVIGIEAADFSAGEGIDPALHEAVERATAMVVDFI
ncbi:hydrogenase maturation protease [Magnetospirillum sulfuroxidans]|uniref:Hydrogenase maturation protease n=1 Tax=Magnetospirillum sulfuroxidans TaxID=611300 RepID=A0ABS5I7Y9_9PROT|nr:hydrogenase maturation protease [Magnetospirillum sulfuroxidans]MBR9970366.1 hydrogenase maturation protease [Magnetospirillum sulfuroxidans]